MREILIEHNGRFYKNALSKNTLIWDKFKKMVDFIWENKDQCFYIPENTENRLLIKNLILENHQLEHTINQFISEMQLRGYSDKTIKSYKGHLFRFYKSMDVKFDDINETGAKKYISMLIQNQIVSFTTLIKQSIVSSFTIS